MEILEVRPARVKAALLAVGDMVVASPVGPDGPRPSTWIGTVAQHVIVDPDELPGHVEVGLRKPELWRKWRLKLMDGTYRDTAVVPADGWVWVHLRHSEE